MKKPKQPAVPLPTKEIDLSQTGECFFDTEPAVSAQFELALNESRKAAAIFIAAEQAYRARTIDDAAYLAARRAFVISGEAFDKAYAAAQERAEPVAECCWKISTQCDLGLCGAEHRADAAKKGGA